jgi:hypothetical protein
MKNVFTFLLAIGVGILTVLLYSNTTEIRKQEHRLEELNVKIESLPKIANFDLQERCAKQATEEYKRQGYTTHQMADFTNHYDNRLNKCFMQIQDTDTHTIPGTIITSKQLADAFEGKVFGNYIWRTQKGKKFWEVPPLECDVILPSGEKTVCHSSEEFDALVKQYME